MSSETTEPVIVADSSPLIGLARIGQLELLKRSGRRILVPPAVWDEVTVHGLGSPGAKEEGPTKSWGSGDGRTVPTPGSAFLIFSCQRTQRDTRAPSKPSCSGAKATRVAFATAEPHPTAV